MSVKLFSPFGKFDFQILMILFLPQAPVNTQFIFWKHVESVILLWKYFVPILNHFVNWTFNLEDEHVKHKIFICISISHEIRKQYKESICAKCIISLLYLFTIRQLITKQGHKKRHKLGLILEGEGGRLFEVNNTPIYMYSCSFLILGL